MKQETTHLIPSCPKSKKTEKKRLEWGLMEKIKMRLKQVGVEEQ